MRKEHKYLLLIVILLSLGVGYAFLNANLTINGTANIKDNTWNVHFVNYQRSYNSTASTISEPVIEGDTTTEISYEVSFQEPGDYYEFTVDVINTGTLNAIIDSLETTVFDGDNELSGIPDYFDYSVTYGNGNEYVLPHELKIKIKDTLLVSLGFKRDITAAQYEEIAGKSFRFNMKVNSIQGSNAGAPTYVYTNSPQYNYVGEELPIEAHVYHNYEDIQTKAFLRHKIVRGIIESTDMGYKYNGGVVFITPYAPNRQDDSFEEVSEELLSIFDCTDYTPGYAIDCGCFYGYTSSPLRAIDGYFSCYASDLNSYCQFSQE